MFEISYIKYFILINAFYLITIFLFIYSKRKLLIETQNREIKNTCSKTISHKKFRTLCVCFLSRLFICSVAVLFKILDIYIYIF